MNDLIKNAIGDLFASKTAVEILKIISINTWNSIGFARNVGGQKIYETTVTQNFLHLLLNAGAYTNYRIKLFEAQLERTNGNDIECFIETRQGFVFFPMQAKIIYNDLRYQRIDHEINSSQQINLLIDYSERKNGYPLYLLYNYCSDSAINNEIRRTEGLACELFGISYVSAYYLRDNYSKARLNRKKQEAWVIPTFQDLHPRFAKPIHEILNQESIEGGSEDFIRKQFDVSDDTILSSVKSFSYEELANNPYWKDLLPEPGIGVLPNWSMKKDVNFDYTLNSKGKFSPRFRMILSRKNNSTKISYVQ